jgi:hypothetical protein
MSQCPGELALVLVHNALLHDEVNALEHAYVGERIALYRDDVGGLSSPTRIKSAAL